MLRRLFVVGAILIAYGWIVIFAGHGAGPVALLMLFGSPSAWLSARSWAGRALSPASQRSAPDQDCLLRRRFWGAVLLVLSVGMFVFRSEVIIFSALTAFPLPGIVLHTLPNSCTRR